MHAHLAVLFTALATGSGSLSGPAFSQPAMLDAAVEILAAAAFDGCPGDRPQRMPIFYRYRAEGAWHRADVAVAAPASAAAVESWLLRPEAFPGWALVDAHGRANLRDLRLDPGRNRGTLFLGPETWRGKSADRPREAPRAGACRCSTPGRSRPRTSNCRFARRRAVSTAARS